VYAVVVPNTVVVPNVVVVSLDVPREVGNTVVNDVVYAVVVLKVVVVLNVVVVLFDVAVLLEVEREVAVALEVAVCPDVPRDVVLDVTRVVSLAVDPVHSR
jgi:hypothetical protein